MAPNKDFRLSLHLSQQGTFTSVSLSPSQTPSREKSPLRRNCQWENGRFPGGTDLPRATLSPRCWGTSHREPQLPLTPRLSPASALASLPGTVCDAWLGTAAPTRPHRPPAGWPEGCFSALSMLRTLILPTAAPPQTQWGFLSAHSPDLSFVLPMPLATP